jgi:16S rRNA (adenine1518-N6/adenine1519-N6)-dimethyltransferase
LKRYPPPHDAATPSHAGPGKHVHKKQFGQHFLHDPGLIRRIVQAVAPKPGERLVEIGPGEGAITLPLLREHGSITVIELDRDLIPRIQAAAAPVGQLDVINADVLTVDFTALAQGQALRLVGNLPYNISSPILFHCLEHAAAVTDMHFMLQKEVVDRMAADPGSKVYGRLSVMLQLSCTVQPLFNVPPGAFNPPPKVDSAVVRLIPLPAAQRHDADPRLVATVVRHAFGQRRKTLSNALGGIASAEQIRAAGVDPKQRAEQLAPMEFVDIAKTIAAGTSS